MHTVNQPFLAREKILRAAQEFLPCIQNIFRYKPDLQYCSCLIKMIYIYSVAPMRINLFPVFCKVKLQQLKVVFSILSTIKALLVAFHDLFDLSRLKFNHRSGLFQKKNKNKFCLTLRTSLQTGSLPNGLNQQRIPSVPAVRTVPIVSLWGILVRPRTSLK